MLGGRKTAEQDDILTPHRDALYARIAALPEGTLFTTEDIVKSGQEAQDFAALRDYDYIHVADGFFVGIVETKYLRRLPKLEAMLASYMARKGCVLSETGDRIAWRVGLKQWEPIEGYRYYTDREEGLLSFGHMRIRIIPGPAWIRSEQRVARLFRCFYDQPERDIPQSLKRVAAHAKISEEDLRAAADYGLAVDPADVPDNWTNPAATSALIVSHLENRTEI